MWIRGNHGLDTRDHLHLQNRSGIADDELYICRYCKEYRSDHVNVAEKKIRK